MQSQEKAMTIGYNKPLYILPFDHRSSFAKGLFGWKGPLTEEQTEIIVQSSGKGTRFHRICGRSHFFLGPACCNARRQGCSRRGCRRDRQQVHEMDSDLCRREKGVEAMLPSEIHLLDYSD